jgi:hypothetical protein
LIPDSGLEHATEELADLVESVAVNAALARLLPIHARAAATWNELALAASRRPKWGPTVGPTVMPPSVDHC